MWNVKQELREYLSDVRRDSEAMVNYAMDLLETVARKEIEDLLKSLIEEDSDKERQEAKKCDLRKRMEGKRIFIDGVLIVREYFDPKQQTTVVITEDEETIVLTDKEAGWLDDCLNAFYSGKYEQRQYNRFKVSW